MMFNKLSYTLVSAMSLCYVGAMTFSDGDNVVEDPEQGKDLTVERGTIIGREQDSLYTQGLATCVGAGAVNVGEGMVEYNKVLGHIRCDDAGALLEEWKREVEDIFPLDLRVVISVVNPNILDEAVRDAQRELNRASLISALTLVGENETWKVFPVQRQTVDGPLPLGSFKIEKDRTFNIEGQVVIPPTAPTLNVPCYWPIQYTPANAPDQTREEMMELADKICRDADGCRDKPGSTAYCVPDADPSYGQVSWSDDFL